MAGVYVVGVVVGGEYPRGLCVRRVMIESIRGVVLVVNKVMNGSVWVMSLFRMNGCICSKNAGLSILCLENC